MNDAYRDDLDVLFQERLSRIPVPPRPLRRPPSTRRRLAAAIVAAVLAVAMMGLVLGANASADSQGATCADLVTRIKLLTGTMHVVHEGSVTHESRAHDASDQCEVHGTTITVSHR